MTSQRPESLWSRLEPLLAKVQKPARYIGCEDGAIVPQHGPGKVSWLLTYPDTYEVGLPNQGLQILYEILNERDDAVAERTYAPWTDLEALLRGRGVPLFSVDTHRPAGDFDLIAFNLSAELVYTNVLNCVDLAGVPVRSAETAPGAPARRDRRPLPRSTPSRSPTTSTSPCSVRARRSSARSPRSSRRGRRSGRTEGSREAVLRALAAGARGVRAVDVRRQLRRPRARRRHPEVPRVPAVVAQAHRRRPRRVAVPEAPARAAHRSGPRPPVGRGVPWLHPRLPVLPGGDDHPPGARTARRAGPDHGARTACAAPDTTRSASPRSRPPTSRASSELVAGIAADTPDGVRGQTSINLPSLRVDAFTVGVAAGVGGARRSGLTFAPEAGSWRLRQVINKLITEADLYGAVDAAFSQGWTRIKLYFLTGLPTEQDERHPRASPSWPATASPIGRRHTNRASVTVSLGGFVPKAAHAVPVVRPEHGRGAAAQDQPRPHRHPQGQGGQPEVARPRGIDRRRHRQPRGDRRIGAGHRAGLADGRHVPGVGRALPAVRWEEAMAAEGLSLDWYVHRHRTEDEVLPWDHLQAGLAQGLPVAGLAGGAGRERGRGLPLDALLRLRRLHRLRHRARGRIAGAARRRQPGNRAGLVDRWRGAGRADHRRLGASRLCRSRTAASSSIVSASRSRSVASTRSTSRRSRLAGLMRVNHVRVRFTKLGKVRFVGHRDVARLWERIAAQGLGARCLQRRLLAAAAAVVRAGAAHRRRVVGRVPRHRPSMAMSISSELAELLHRSLPPGFAVQAVTGDRPERSFAAGRRGRRARGRSSLRGLSVGEVEARVARSCSRPRSCCWSESARESVGSTTSARRSTPSPFGRRASRAPSCSPSWQPDRGGCVRANCSPSRSPTRRPGPSCCGRILRTHQWIERDGARRELLPLDAAAVAARRSVWA